MQLNYNIIWIDDEINKLKASGDLDQVLDFLRELGFNPNLLPLKDGADITKYFDEIKYDLIISDYNIQDGQQGDSIIKELRDRKINNEVLFYSSQTNLKEIAVKLLGYDRISFHSGRRGLIEKIEDLISLSVSKLLELNATRGLITSETSELDVIIEQIVMDLAYNKLKLTDDTLSQIVEEYIEGFLRKSPDKLMAKYQELGFEKFFHKIEANRKWGIFRDLLKKNPTDEVLTFLDINKTYGDDVIGVRNKFAHSKSIIKDGTLHLAGFGQDGEAYVCDDKQCISIRKKLITHRESFLGLADHLSVKLD
ncbi:DNA-binding transcriptional response regulator [Pedobacter hiemivivus]|uniref:Response regulator n=1 Tax=Pedobacter hiemivivus TaxID=2530454 RepID=A0A4R0NA62_9SPHI|nr:response regulator [Pedobacter hiemivivus]TCC97128.1 response regulator [Pedobacter hiemivivus]